MLRNIIWDVDGTLFDTYPPIAKAFQEALDELGIKASRRSIESLAKISLGHCVSVLAGAWRLREADLERKFQEHYSRVKPEDQPPFPGVTRLCGYICSLGGRNVIVTHRGRAGTVELLAAHGLAKSFAGLVTRDDGYPRKPDPAAFEAALEIHGLRREETLTVGDREIDIQAGRAAGLFTCFFGTETQGAGADLVIARFDELYRFLESRFRK